MNEEALDYDLSSRTGPLTPFRDSSTGQGDRTQLGGPRTSYTEGPRHAEGRGPRTVHRHVPARLEEWIRGGFAENGEQHPATPLMS